MAPGFGDRGIEGKIKAVQYVRENNIPFLGICLGMQCAVVEYCRNVVGLSDAASSEVNPEAAHLVIDLMLEQKEISKKGGTMRLGAYDCDIKPGTRAAQIYAQKTQITERHRHRYEFNNKYREQIESFGMVPSGINPQSDLVEIVEIPEHPFYVGVQFHPEYRSRVEEPHPLFVALVEAAIEYKNTKSLASSL